MGDQVILATGGYDHTIKLWHTHSGICYRTMQHAESQINALAISPDRQFLAVASYQHIYMYDLNSNNPNAVVNYDGTGKNVVAIGFNKEGTWMYSGGEDCKVRTWPLKDNGKDLPKMFEVLAPVTCACLHPNGVELFVGDQSGIIHRWDLITDHNEQLIPESDAMILSLDISTKGNLMAAVNNKGKCYIWGLKGKTDEPTKMIPKHKFDAHKRHVLKCKFSDNIRYLITTSADQTAKIWNTGDFSLHQELKQENQRWVWDAAFSHDAQWVWTASSDGCVKLWNVETGQLEREYAGHQKAVTALAFKDVIVLDKEKDEETD